MKKKVVLIFTMIFGVITISFDETKPKDSTPIQEKSIESCLDDFKYVLDSINVKINEIR